MPLAAIRKSRPQLGKRCFVAGFAGGRRFAHSGSLRNCAHVGDQDVLRLRIHEVEAQLVDHHHFHLDPFLPRLVADVGLDGGAQLAAPGDALGGRRPFLEPAAEDPVVVAGGPRRPVGRGDGGRRAFRLGHVGGEFFGHGGLRPFGVVSGFSPLGEHVLEIGDRFLEALLAGRPWAPSRAPRGRW